MKVVPTSNLDFDLGVWGSILRLDLVETTSSTLYQHADL